MIFLSKPSVYNLPGTWEKQPMIHHLNLTPDQGFILFFGLVLFGLVGWGLYLTVGGGKKELRDPIDEAARSDQKKMLKDVGGIDFVLNRGNYAGTPVGS